MSNALKLVAPENLPSWTPNASLISRRQLSTVHIPIRRCSGSMEAGIAAGYEQLDELLSQVAAG